MLVQISGCNLYFCQRGKEGEKRLDSLLNG